MQKMISEFHKPCQFVSVALGDVRGGCSLSPQSVCISKPPCVSLFSSLCVSLLRLGLDLDRPAGRGLSVCVFVCVCVSARVCVHVCMCLSMKAGQRL